MEKSGVLLKSEFAAALEANASIVCSDRSAEACFNFFDVGRTGTITWASWSGAYFERRKLGIKSIEPGGKVWKRLLKWISRHT